MDIDKKQVLKKGAEPFINEQSLKPFLTCTDHTVSRETFSLLLDPDTDLLITSPQPATEDLSAYYESEDYISHTDSKRTLMDRVYQVIKVYSLKRKLKLINENASRKGSILDVGCGTGDLLSICEKDGWQIFGIEPNKKARELALNKISSQFSLNKDLEELSKSLNNPFEVITLWHVLEHIPNLFEYIEKLKDMLSPEGCLIIAVPNFKSYDADYYKEFWAAYDVPRHLWHFSEKSIRHIFGRFDFDIVNTKPLIFDSFYVSLLSEKYKSGRSNLISAFKTGLLSNLKARRTGEFSSKIYVLKKR